VQATPYSSSGASYSQFALIDQGNGSFAITRVVSSANATGDIRQVELAEGVNPKTL
jgi:hypothetical protein